MSHDSVETSVFRAAFEPDWFVTITTRFDNLSSLLVVFFPHENVLVLRDTTISLDFDTLREDSESWYQRPMPGPPAAATSSRAVVADELTTIKEEVAAAALAVASSPSSWAARCSAWRTQAAAATEAKFSPNCWAKIVWAHREPTP